MRIFFLLVLLTCSARAPGQAIPEFSDLSSRPLSSQSGCSSLKIPDGMLYYVNTPDFPNKLYKVNFDGMLLDSAVFSTDVYRYSGQLYSTNGRFFLIGDERKPFVNWLQASADSRRCVIEFDENLDVVRIDRYNLLPAPAGTGVGVITSLQFTVGSGSTLFQPIAAHHLKGDTMMMLRSYVFFDTSTFQEQGRSLLLEKVVLGDTSYTVRNISNYTEQLRGAVIQDDSIYVFANASECCGGFLLDYTSVGVFNADGDWVRKIAVLSEPGGLDEIAADANGILLYDRIFTSYTDVNNIFNPACESAVIDIRDKNFNSLRLAKSPLCGFYPAGARCSAQSGNTIYFHVRSSDGDIGLCRYDSLLDLQWSQVYDFNEPHLGISVNTTPDGGCLLECVASSDNNNILKLYKISPEGNIISSVTLPAGREQLVLVYPNPFIDEINIEAAGQTSLTVELFDAGGKPVWRQQTTGLPLRVEPALPPGIYFLRAGTQDGTQLICNQPLVRLR
jgi:hypothetical protein